MKFKTWCEFLVLAWILSCGVIGEAGYARDITRGGAKEATISDSCTVIWQANRFETRVDWDGGRTNCSASAQCSTNDTHTPVYFEPGYALSSEVDNGWENGTKLFQNQVYSDPNEDFRYLVVGFNLTLYGQFECRFFNGSRKGRNVRLANDSNVFEIYIQGEGRAFPTQVYDVSRNCSVQQGDCLNCAFAYNVMSKVFPKGWPNYNYNYVNQSAPQGPALAAYRSNNNNPPLLPVTPLNSSNTIALVVRRGVIAISAIELTPLLCQVPNNKTKNTTTTTTTTAGPTSTTSHTTTSGPTTAGPTTTTTTGNSTTGHQTTTGPTTGPTTLGPSTTTGTGDGAGGNGDVLGLSQKVWIGIGIAAGVTLAAAVCISGWLMWWYCYHNKPSGIPMDYDDDDDRFFGGGRGRYRGKQRYQPIAGYEISSRHGMGRDGEVVATLGGWRGLEDVEGMGGGGRMSGMLLGGPQVGEVGANGGVVGRNRSLSKAKSFSNLAHLRDPRYTDATGSFKSSFSMEKRKLLWNFDPREKDASGTIIGMRIGRGSKGDVFKGVSQIAGVVAIKVLRIPMSDLDEDYSSALTQYFETQAEKARKLHHPNLLQVYMVFTDGSDQLCMSMEYMALGRLYDVIKNHSLFLDYEKIKRILIGASHAMAYLHNQHARTIHGELSSYSLLINDNWECKVGGFGIHRLIKSAKKSGSGSSSSTDEKRALLAPWTAPELLSDNDTSENSNSNYDRLTEKADVYSFGVIMWECITRRDASKFDYEELQSSLKGDDVPIDFVDLIAECCSPDPERRPRFHQLIMDIASVHYAVAPGSDGDEDHEDREGSFGSLGSDGEKGQKRVSGRSSKDNNNSNNTNSNGNEKAKRRSGVLMRSPLGGRSEKASDWKGGSWKGK